MFVSRIPHAKAVTSTQLLARLSRRVQRKGADCCTSPQYCITRILVVWYSCESAAFADGNNHSLILSFDSGNRTTLRRFRAESKTTVEGYELDKAFHLPTQAWFDFVNQVDPSCNSSIHTRALTHARTRTHAHTHTRAHAHTREHAQTRTCTHTRRST